MFPRTGPRWARMSFEEATTMRPVTHISLVVMLASERTANVTGANYVIDGGDRKSVV